MFLRGKRNFQISWSQFFLGHPVLPSILLHSCCMSIWPKSAFFSHLLKRLTDGDWSQWIFGDWRQWKSTIHQIVNHQIVTYTDWRSSGYLSNYFTKIYTHSWSIFDVMSALVTVLSIQTEIRETPIKQAEKLKSRKMKNDEGWRMNEEGWGMNDEGLWFQAVEGFWWWTNRRTGICDCRVAFTTEKRHLYLIALINYVL